MKWPLMYQSKFAMDVGRLCPCGKGVGYRCAWCHRALCVEHMAHGPFEENGEVVLKPVCWPKCDAKWWAEIRDATPEAR